MGYLSAMIPPASPHVEPRVALKSILGFWAFYFTVNTLHMLFAGNPHQLEMVVRRTGVVLVGILITLAMYAVLRRLEHKSMPLLVGAVFLVSVPGAWAYAMVNFTAFYLAVPNDSVMREVAQLHAAHSTPMAEIWDYAISWYFFLVSWGVLYVALSYAAKVRHAERSAAAYRTQAQAAQLRALRYQINPHFLFNTLNSLSTLVLAQRTQEADDMICALSTFFRTSLTNDVAADVTLADEIGLQRLYLEIERIRFPERLLVSVDVPPDLETALVPGMILQPLVENAIKHGVAHTSVPVTVTIRAWAQGESLRLSVVDDAHGVIQPPRRDGVGLSNVRERLAARFEGAASVSHGLRPGGGFRVDLTMPLMRHG
jgi:hypothetical protein